MRKRIVFLIIPILFSGVFSCGSKQIPLQQPDMRLWYQQPASRWVEALPVGNGRLGAMVFGGVFQERIQLNEESLWAGQPIDNNNPEALRHLPELQRLLLAERINEAERLVAKYFIGTPPRIRSYQTAGDIFIVADSTAPFYQYQRELVLEHGIARTVFSIGKTNYVREVFASAPDDILVIHTKAEGPEKINVKISLTRKKDAVVTGKNGNELVMIGQINDPPDEQRGPGGKHLCFAEMLQARTQGGSVEVQDSILVVRGAQELTLLFTAVTDYDPETLGFDRSKNPEAESRKILMRVNPKSYQQILQDHIRDHAALFNRVTLRLPKTEISSLPTDKRLEAVKQDKSDPELAALYFQFGRYLLMGSSRAPGVLPANLQGIWNEKFTAPWNSDFHTNINLQMNYWPAEVANLSECVVPLSQFLQKLTVPGARTARKMYGAGGWTLHHLTDPYGRTGVMDGPWGLTPMDGPWMTFPVWRHFAFSLDTTYLRTVAYPLMKGAARFVLDFLIESSEGWLVTAPSSSPENSYFIPGTNQRAKLAYAATMDIEIITGLFSRCLQASRILQTDRVFADSLQQALKRLPPLQIGKDGTLQEWIKDYQEVNPGHRHISHLLGLYPLGIINPDTPELFEAAKATIARRLANGGGHTGWSRAWIINFYNRLQMPEESYKHLLLLFKKSTLPNLFDTHPPFQIDGNFGGTAGIAGMLLQSHGGMIRLLPALPEAWPEGEVTGLKARGGFMVDLVWRDHRLQEAKIRATKETLCNLVYGDKKYTFTAQANSRYRFDGDLKPVQ